MPNFFAVLNCSNHAHREKDKSNYHFPQLLKIMAKKAWNIQKWEGKSGYLKFSGKI